MRINKHNKNEKDIIPETACIKLPTGLYYSDNMSQSQETNLQWVLPFSMFVCLTNWCMTWLKSLSLLKHFFFF